ncbi:hypothetical protein GCM10010869_44510 [Mesorhizobium tianshanense]|uniref:Uncharacterized protein n=1 Tax=Mesorhizobium tianshanense TaxID=39844 RepID=A0A562N804_9HYPH|nr:DUF6636 domain-containing protein [Mesorhizobium tianshanense]TWI28266.1 hypothetical protein IQ26_05306 [Mesorhizobium tianshanense]GLS38854.1 hypothetical protein GCM10010869_44510 [Mesorhizobium tianshanense]
MRKTIVTISLCFGLVTAVRAANEDYVGPFPTEGLYMMCSQSNQRDKCLMYIQGLMYGLRIQREMHEQGMPICVPEISSEEARVRILNFIDGATGGNPQTNKDGGDWMAFMGLAAGNVCGQHIGFRTPSNNIHCQLNGSNNYLRCDIRELSNAVPQKPRDCDLEWGTTFSISEDGDSGSRMCVGDTVEDDALPILDYGSSWNRGGYECKSEPSGLSCVNALGHGFTISRNRQELF